MFLSLAMVTATTLATAGDWPRFRGLNHDGISTEKNWLGTWPGGQPKRLWKATVGIGFSSMTIAEGRLYTVGNDGVKKGGKDTVYCLDAATGREIWRRSYEQDLDPKYYDGGPGATPTVSEGRVYVLGRHGLAQCLDAETGEVIWSRDVAKELEVKIPEWGFNGSVHIEDGLAVLNIGSFGAALDKNTGREVWVSGKEEAGYGTPVAFEREGRRALAIFAAKHVVAVDPKTGRELWRAPWKTEYDVNASDPVISGNRMFLSSGYGTGGAGFDIGGAAPKQIWFNKEIRAHMAGSVVIDGHVYGVDGQGGDKNSQLKCLDLETGAVKWTSPKAETGNLAAADGRLLWLTGGGELVVVEAKSDSYREVVRAQVNGGKHWTAPVLANGRVYVRNAKGDVICVDVKGSGPVI
jgi:outer membrane protein assembly factor BamB